MEKDPVGSTLAVAAIRPSTVSSTGGQLGVPQKPVPNAATVWPAVVGFGTIRSDGAVCAPADGAANADRTIAKIATRTRG